MYIISQGTNEAAFFFIHVHIDIYVYTYIYSVHFVKKGKEKVLMLTRYKEKN